MGKRIFKDLEPVPKGPHADYEKNLSKARLFCLNSQKLFLKGMVTKIADSEGLKDVLLRISFTPPRETKMGNYAAPIFLHQSASEVEKQTQAVFSAYMSMAKKFWDDFSKTMQPDLINKL